MDIHTTSKAKNAVQYHCMFLHKMTFFLSACYCTIVDSMYADITTKVNRADVKKKCVVDHGVFYFNKPQDTS